MSDRMGKINYILMSKVFFYIIMFKAARLFDIIHQMAILAWIIYFRMYIYSNVTIFLAGFLEFSPCLDRVYHA